MSAINRTFNSNEDPLFTGDCNLLSLANEGNSSPEPSEKAIAPPQEYTIILVGSQKVKEILGKKLKKREIQGQLTTDKILWSRDCRVIRPDGVHLLPAFFSHENPKYREFFYSLLPQEMLHFYKEDLCFVGNGYSESYYQTAVRTAEILDMHYEEGVSCIEGGNCRIFIASDGKPKAIIGYNSLLLSLAHLYETSYFQDNAHRLNEYKNSRKDTPIDPDQLRIAKNMYFCLHHSEDFDIEQTPKDLTNPLWIDIAKEVEGMIEMTKEEISIDLGIPLDRIAFVFQEQFHIDMELFPVSSPKGDLVFLHDERLMLKVQRDLNPHSKMTPFLAMQTFPYSFTHVSANEKIVAYNTQELERIGCKAVPVPGVLHAEYRKGNAISYSYIAQNWMKDDCHPFLLHQDSVKVLEGPLYLNIVNFMNGLYFADPSPCFITSAPPKGDLVVDQLTNAFKKAIHAVYPELKISFVREVVPAHLIEFSGGLHCMTSVLKKRI